jgi:hypothetical protein
VAGEHRLWAENRADIAASGCPFGTLCAELNKRDRGLDRRSAVLLSTAADWTRNSSGNGAVRTPPNRR